MTPSPEMTLAERLDSDLRGTGLTVGPHPMALYREALARARRACGRPTCRGSRTAQRVRVAGAVICRQRPGTAKGFLFLTLEDETGLVNVIVRPDLFERDHAVLVTHGRPRDRRRAAGARRHARCGPCGPGRRRSRTCPSPRRDFH